jgi:hypothetical protein
MFSHASKPKAANFKASGSSKGKRKADKGPPCTNCAKPSHTKQDCWAKGGGAEGSGPPQKRRAARQDKEKAKDASPKSESAKVASTNDVDDVSTLYALPAVDSRSASNAWLLDSGASRHMTPHRHWFATYQALTTPVLIRVGDGNKIPAIGVGRILVIIRNRQGRESQAVIKSVLYVPALNANLLSVRELVEGGTDVLFRKNSGAVLVANQGQGP